MRHIKKYSNRRLYDSTSSSYINMDDLIQLVREGEEIQVTEETTGNDITNTLLLQSILENNSTVQVFPTQLLHRLIRLQSEEDIQSTLANKIAVGLQRLDAQLAKLEGANWSDFSAWNPFSTSSPQTDEEVNTEETKETVQASVPEDTTCVNEDSPKEKGPEDSRSSENDSVSEADRPSSADSKKKSVVDQQLDTIRAHIASLEARLRKP